MQKVTVSVRIQIQPCLVKLRLLISDVIHRQKRKVPIMEPVNPAMKTLMKF